MSDYYQTCGTPKPEPRRKSKRRAQRIYGDYVAEVRCFVFGRERNICRICRIRRADSMHELVFRSQGGKVSRVNSIAVCGSGTTGCHGLIHSRQINVLSTAHVGAQGVLTFTPVTERAAEWMRVALNQSIESAPMSIYEVLE